MNSNARLGAAFPWGGGDRACLCWLRLCLFLAMVAVFPTSASAQVMELVVDGDFDQNGMGWALTVTNNPNTGRRGCGEPPNPNIPNDPGAPPTGCWFLNGPGLRTPLTGLPTMVGTEHGTYVITDMTVIGTRALYQDIFVPQSNRRVTLSFDLFVNDWASLTSFDERQYARVDLMTNTSNPIDHAGVLFNAYVGTDGGPLPNPFRHYEFDISPFVANSGNYRIRFFGHNVISSGIPLNVGVDNVSVLLVPEPGMAGLCLVGLILAATARRRAK